MKFILGYGSEGKPSVVHSAEVRAHHEEEGALKRLEKVYEEVLWGDGHEEAACAFYDERLGEGFPLA